jgi:hypothetical protein
VKISPTSDKAEMTEQEVINLICNGISVKKVVVNNATFTLKSLTTEESSEVSKETGHSLTELATNLSIMDAFKLPVLKRSIIEIDNGQKSIQFNKSNMNTLGNILNQLPAAVVDRLFMSYIEMIGEIMSLLGLNEKKTS